MAAIAVLGGGGDGDDLGGRHGVGQAGKVLGVVVRCAVRADHRHRYVVTATQHLMHIGVTRAARQLALVSMSKPAARIPATLRDGGRMTVS